MVGGGILSQSNVQPRGTQDMNKRQHSDDYYPIRWKIADGIEDMFVLHRNTVVGALALLGTLAIVFGLLIFDRGDSTTTETAAPTTTINEAAADTDTDDDNEEAEAEAETTTTAAPETATTTAAPETTTTSTTTSTTTTTTTATIPARAATEAQIASTENGRLIRLTDTTVEIIGGVPNEDAADSTLTLAAETFPDLTLTDDQFVDAEFEDGPVTFRIDAPDLFAYNSDDLDPIYLPVIDQLAATIIAQGWSVEVGGHTDASGPDAGNQALSEGRAASAAARLRAQGVDPASITTVGFGETQPIADNATEAGRLANRRVEFVINQ